MHCQTDMQSTMFIKKPKSRPTRIFTPSWEVGHLANQFRGENTVVGCKSVKNDAVGDVNEQRLKAEGLVRALPKVSQCWVRLGPRLLVWWATSGRPAYPNHQWYGFKKDISQMKMSKALDTSGIVVEMIQAADDKGASKICDLAAAIN